jgi:hypothetical protein
MSFGDILKDSLLSALRNPGDSSSTRREFRARQADRRADRAVGESGAEILALVAQKQRETDARIAKQREKGHRVNRDVLWTHAVILGDRQALIKFYENDDPNRIDIYYGGQGKPNGKNHGHIVIRSGQMISWETDGNRIKLV